MSNAFLHLIHMASSHFAHCSMMIIYVIRSIGLSKDFLFKKSSVWEIFWSDTSDLHKCLKKHV